MYTTGELRLKGTSGGHFTLRTLTGLCSDSNHIRYEQARTCSRVALDISNRQFYPPEYQDASIRRKLPSQSISDLNRTRSRICNRHALRVWGKGGTISIRDRHNCLKSPSPKLDLCKHLTPHPVIFFAAWLLPYFHSSSFSWTAFLIIRVLYSEAAQYAIRYRRKGKLQTVLEVQPC